MSDIYHKLVSGSNELSDKLFDAVILLVDTQLLDAKDQVKGLKPLPKKLADHATTMAKRLSFKWEPGDILSFDASPNQRVVLACLPDPASMFNTLSLAKKVFEPLFAFKARSIALDLRLSHEHEQTAADAFLSAMIYKTYEFPKYGQGKSQEKPKKEKPTKPILSIVSASEDLAGLLERTEAVCSGTNLVRELATKACNDLNCKNYVNLATKMAKQEGLSTEFFTFEKLKKMGAGAFVAVAQGSNHKDSGILKIQYKPKKKFKHVALVGKGITYDTGGVNVKTGTYMYGMQIDMSGSAIVLATILYAAKQKLPVQITAYLAIADNAISNEAYRPNEIIHSLSGKTIEVIHTDAEGRMVLADTLTLSAKEKPDLIIDFATLTGSCVRAIGTTYSGIFSNFHHLHPILTEAGTESGERVWPFPTDKDFGEYLDSEIADLKQCRLTGGVDHIEAAMFLSQFFDKKIPWVHVDLSAIENDGGLGGVPNKITGFGVRLAAKLLDKVDGLAR